MPLPREFLFWFCCFSWLCFPISLCSLASRRESQIVPSADLEPETESWSLLQPLGEKDRAGLFPALFKVLYVGQSGVPRLQPDSRALHYMKRLYKAYATKEGIPKLNRSHLYNTIRLFTPNVQHKRASADQVTGV